MTTTNRITPQQHLAEVLARYDDAPDPRLAEITRSLIRHLHEFVTDVGLTRDEWMTGILALTTIGQMCNDERQEFILLSDTLGVSMLVEMLGHPTVDGTTEPTVFGPFHVDGAPRREMGESIVTDPGAADEPLTVSGTVRTTDGQPIDGARLDVWQTASNGLYDVQDPEQTPMNLRGMFTTGPDGSYEVVTVRPVAYQIPGDGPAGQLLFANGRDNWRPAHVHFVVSAPGHRTLTTHLFDAASDHLDEDAVFGVRSSLVTDMQGGACTYDFVLEPIS